MITYISPAVQANTGLLRAGRTRLLNVKCTNNGAAAAFLQVHNKASALAGGETPLFFVTIGAGGFASLEKFFLSLGCICALSSTGPTYTAYANGWFYVEIEDV
jgi:hypothetical protein